MATSNIGLVELPYVQAWGVRKSFILIQGGMGMRVSCPKLSGKSSRRGAIGTLSSAGLPEFYIESNGKKASARNAARYEVEAACLETGQRNPFIAMNIMVKLKDFKESVIGAIQGGVSAIISGAGVPKSLPGIVRDVDALDYVALIPIVSSAKSARTICKKWWKSYGYVPDAIVVEGDKAGGHLGFELEDIGNEENSLERIFSEVRQSVDEFYQDKGGIHVPVIVAGGIFYNEDIAYWIDRVGADGVQMGSRFAATLESGASPEFKKAIIESTEDDIIVCDKSPCGFLFRVIKNSPGYQEALYDPKAAICRYGYVLQKDIEKDVFIHCLAKDTCRYFCICGGLVAATGKESKQGAIFTIGARGHEIKKIISVDELFDELGIIQS